MTFEWPYLTIEEREQRAFDVYVQDNYGSLTEYAKRHTGSSARFERKAFSAGFRAALNYPTIKRNNNDNQSNAGSKLRPEKD